jgi:hypothetical protein
VTAQTHIDLEFADGEYRFALGLEQINELQNACGDGIGAIYARVLQGRVASDVTVGHPGYAAYKLSDLVETVRQGLIGGGQGLVNEQPVKVEAMRANQLVANYLHALPLSKQWDLAAAILYAKVEGYEPAVDEADEGDGSHAPGDDKKKEDGLTTREPSPTV